MADSLSRTWSCPLNGKPLGLDVAREGGQILAWDDQRWLTLLSAEGRVLASRRMSSPITAAVIADDGRRGAVGAADGFSRFDQGLETTAEIGTTSPVQAIATDAAGEFILSGERGGRIALWGGDGRTIREVMPPRPAKHLALLVTSPHAVVASDLGFIGRLNLTNGEWVWRDRPVVHMGAIAVDPAGERVLVACFSEGVRLYLPDGKAEPLPWAAKAHPRQIALDVRGRRFVVLGTDADAVVIGDMAGSLRRLPTAVSASHVRLSGPGDTIYLASGDRTIRAFDLG